MATEAKVVGGVPQGNGWFVVNARDASWSHNELGGYCGFEGQDDAAFDDLGINLNVLPPGKPMAMYHEEPGQEGFLVLRGECLLIVEGAGDEPAVVLAVGARKGVASYPVDATAIGHGAGVDRDGLPPAEAYARFSKPEPGPAPELR